MGQRKDGPLAPASRSTYESTSPQTKNLWCRVTLERTWNNMPEENSFAISVGYWGGGRKVECRRLYTGLARLTSMDSASSRTIVGCKEHDTGTKVVMGSPRSREKEIERKRLNAEVGSVGVSCPTIPKASMGKSWLSPGHPLTAPHDGLQEVGVPRRETSRRGSSPLISPAPPGRLC